MEFLVPTQDDIDRYDAYMWDAYKNIIASSMQTVALRRHFNELVGRCKDDQVIYGEFKGGDIEKIEQLNDFFDYYTFLKSVHNLIPKGEYGEASFVLASPESED